MLNPDFSELILKYDVLIFVETKLDELDTIDLPNDYLFYCKNRKGCKRKSGGIIIIYKKCLSNFIKFIDSESDVVQWVELNLNLESKVYLGCVYIPPENSVYSSENSFIELENDIINFSQKSKYVSLVGDFNARTARLPDYVTPDENLLEEILHIVDDDLTENMYTHKILENIGIPLERFNKDEGRINPYGHKLLDLCKRCSLFIVNGRLHADKLCGKTTSKNISTVDYLIMFPLLIQYIIEFEICDFNPMFSDIHNRIHFTILSKNDKHDNRAKVSEGEKIIKWNQVKSQEFVNNLNSDENDCIRELDEKVNSVCIETITKGVIDDLFLDLQNIFVDNAKNTFGTHTPKKRLNDHNKSKPWFNKTCAEKRKEFNKLRDKYKHDKSDQVKNELNLKAKEFRNAMNKSFELFQEQNATKLRQTSKSDPKEMWKILNNMNFSNKKDANIDIDKLYEYFKKLNDTSEDVVDEDDSDAFLDNICDNDLYDVIINGEITEDEVNEAIKGLKNGKASGIDEFVNEYFKCSSPHLVSIFCKLFNIVFDSGIVPDTWLNGIIRPIYKNKGDPNDPDNYRAITLISCLGKLFTSIINSRLNFLSSEFDIISKCQSGFRKGYSTTDNIFIMHALISLYLTYGKKLYCTFVDFRKAFDTVWRVGLWKKLQNYGIKGKCFRIIYNMYDNIKSCVSFNNQTSDFFLCLNGVRQGENLSPFLFSIFLNDLEKYFEDLNVLPLTVIKEKIENTLHHLIKIFVLLYADDTVIFSESEEGMQKALDIFQEFCTKWKLSVNVSKTKVIIFSKRKSRNNPVFKLNGIELDIVDSLTYLGIVFKFNGNFSDARKKLVEQSQKSLFSIFKKIRNHSIPVDVQLKLFDSLVEPILLYGSEVWGYENLEIIERVHLQFCKRILNLRPSTPNFMVYGELGRHPLHVRANMRMVSFWCRLLKNETKLSSILYKLMLALNINEGMNFRWIAHIRSLFDNTGLGYIFANQLHIEWNTLKPVLYNRFRDQFIQSWFSNIVNSSKGDFYETFKTDFGIENYLLRLPESKRKYITKLRTCNLKLPIETGRWNKTPRHERICPLCRNGIGDEYHYLFICDNESIVQLRQTYIPRYYYVNPSVYKMKGMLTFCHVKLLSYIATFVSKLNKYFL